MLNLIYFYFSRNTLNEIYFGKTRDIVNGLRSVQPLDQSKQQDDLRKDLVIALASKNVTKAEWKLKFLILVLYLWLLSEYPKFPKKSTTRQWWQKKQKSIRKITRSTFSFLPPCDDKNEKKRKHTQDWEEHCYTTLWFAAPPPTSFCNFPNRVNKVIKT